MSALRCSVDAQAQEAPVVSAVETIKIDVWFGYIRLESRLRSEGNKLIGEGRSWHYDQYGALIKDSGWQPTGCELILP
jgi:pectin methylesterase-like acyl-CoA thioesterase